MRTPTRAITDSKVVIGSVRCARLGRIWAARSDHGLVAVDFGVTRSHFVRDVRRLTRKRIVYSPGDLSRQLHQIAEYLRGVRRNFDLAIDWSFCSEFQRAALGAVKAIPYGQTRTYGEIAQRIGRPSALRAVGRANASNPMPLVIPCHRVIGKDGGLRGYGGAGGLRTKAWLLKMESARARS